MNKKIEVYFLSFPKAGRTWITTLISRVLQKKHGFSEKCALKLEELSKIISELPRIRIMHDDNPHLKSSEHIMKDKNRFRDKKVILLIRDPRDIIVSLYFHQSRRKGRSNYRGSIRDFIFKYKGGFNSLITYYNVWASNRHIPRKFLVLKYEDFKLDAEKSLRKLIRFIGIKKINNKEIIEAIEFASFDNMHKMEAENKFRVKRLRPGKVSDPESYKVRKGIVGGYKDYLSKKDISKLNLKMKNLSKSYNYK